MEPLMMGEYRVDELSDKDLITLIGLLESVKMSRASRLGWVQRAKAWFFKNLLNFKTVVTILSLIFSLVALTQLNEKVPLLTYKVESAQSRLEDLLNSTLIASGQLDSLSGMTTSLLSFQSEAVNLSARVETQRSAIDSALASVQRGVSDLSSNSHLISEAVSLNAALLNKTSAMQADLTVSQLLAARVSSEVSTLQGQLSQLSGVGAAIDLLDSKVINLTSVVERVGCVNCGRLVGVNGSAAGGSSVTGNSINWTQCGSPLIASRFLISSDDRINTTYSVSIFFDNQPLVLASVTAILGFANVTHTLGIPISFCWSQVFLRVTSFSGWYWQTTSSSIITVGS
jgi:cell division protein FtsL